MILKLRCSWLLYPAARTSATEYHLTTPARAPLDGWHRDRRTRQPVRTGLLLHSVGACFGATECCGGLSKFHIGFETCSWPQCGLYRGRACKGSSVSRFWTFHSRSSFGRTGKCPICGRWFLHSQRTTTDSKCLESG